MLYENTVYDLSLLSQVGSKRHPDRILKCTVVSPAETHGTRVCACPYVLKYLTIYFQFVEKKLIPKNFTFKLCSFLLTVMDLL